MSAELPRLYALERAYAWFVEPEFTWARALTQAFILGALLALPLCALLWFADADGAYTGNYPPDVDEPAGSR